ncbi:MAG: hypothetical protein GY813_09315 [Halieaceae bacterium]|nr:hypothetical protein [Halieaceae bacterium]
MQHTKSTIEFVDFVNVWSDVYRTHDLVDIIKPSEILDALRVFELHIDQLRGFALTEGVSTSTLRKCVLKLSKAHEAATANPSAETLANLHRMMKSTFTKDVLQASWQSFAGENNE